MDRHATTQQMDLETYQRSLIEERKTEEQRAAEAEVYRSLPSTTTVIPEDREVPEVREPSSQVLPFTAKKTPFLPQRESQAKEPPMPKPLKPLDGPIEDAHPAWLKDKGDDFFYEGRLRVSGERVLPSHMQRRPLIASSAEQVSCLP
jgi:hypothetical protein